ncbi:MAG: MFS transporter [Candidatus Dormibacteria bacterium]
MSDPVPQRRPVRSRRSVRRAVAVSCLCMALVGFGGSVLFIVLPGIASEFHAEVPALSRLGAILALGSAVALPLSVAADRWRRGPMAALGIVGFSLAALVSSSAPDLAALAGARFAAVCFEALVGAVAMAAAVEAVGPGNRGRTTSLLALSSGAGAALTVVAYPLLAPHWRTLYAAAAAIGLALAPVALLLPDRIGRGHGDVPVIFRPPWRGRLLVLGISAALSGVFYEPVNFFAVLFGSTRLQLSAATLSALLAASGIAAAVGFGVGGLASDRLGRRLPAVFLLVLSIALAAVSYAPSPVLYVGAGLAASLFAGASAPVVGAWTAELVPSRARATAYTAIGVAGALGGVSGLQLVAQFSPGLGLPGALWLMSAAALAGVAVLLMLPETRGIPLPD